MQPVLLWIFFLNLLSTHTAQHFTFSSHLCPLATSSSMHRFWAPFFPRYTNYTLTTLPVTLWIQPGIRQSRITVPFPLEGKAGSSLKGLHCWQNLRAKRFWSQRHLTDMLIFLRNQKEKNRANIKSYIQGTIFFRSSWYKNLGEFSSKI